jgi:hypothetical protein
LTAGEALVKLSPGSQWEFIGERTRALEPLP